MTKLPAFLFQLPQQVIAVEELMFTLIDFEV